jgi:uncharacterized linocin/CFP29 family protein
MDILRRTLAPISDEAWAEIDEEAQRTLRGNLSARGIVDFNGPHGWELGAVNLGRLSAEKAVGGVNWGLRQVQPLLEIRVPFVLSQHELDSVDRGSKTPELEPVQKAAQKIAAFEEKALYLGFPKGGIEGMAKSAGHAPLKLPLKSEGYLDCVEKAVVALQESSIGGPYHLVLGTKPYATVMKGDTKGFSLKARLVDMIGGQIHWSPALKGGVFLSGRGGDFELTVGQDLSIGYASHDRQGVEFYFTESFTFNVNEPAAVVELRAGR